MLSPSPPVLPLGMSRITYPSALTVSYVSARRDWKMKDREKWCRKYTELICEATLNMPSTISSFCFTSFPLQSRGTQEGKKNHHCMAVSFKAGEKKNPLPLWAVITYHCRLLPTHLWENPWLLSCSYGATQTAEQTAVISVGKTGWFYPSFSNFLHFSITLPASSGGSSSLPWHTVPNNCDAVLKVAPSTAVMPGLLSLAMCGGNLCAFSHVSLLAFG